MYTLAVKNDRDEVLNLTENPNYIVYKIEGLNPPKATINSSINATSDGSCIHSTRTENRNIVIYLTICGDIERNRLMLYQYFPIKKMVTLYFTNTSKEVLIQGAVELIECDLFSQRQIAQISMICPQPYFKAVEELIISFGDVVERFEFPFSIPASGMEFSSIVASQRKTILNTGDEEIGVLIELFALGTVVHPVIYDVDTRGSMRLNLTMQVGDRIRINTNVGEKEITLIRDGESFNAIGYMAVTSEWFQLQSGDNVFSYDADSGRSSLQITFTTSPLYSGV